MVTSFFWNTTDESKKANKKEKIGRNIFIYEKKEQEKEVGGIWQYQYPMYISDLPLTVPCISTRYNRVNISYYHDHQPLCNFSVIMVAVTSKIRTQNLVVMF